MREFLIHIIKNGPKFKEHKLPKLSEILKSTSLCLKSTLLPKTFWLLPKVFCSQRRELSIMVETDNI